MAKRVLINFDVQDVDQKISSLDFKTLGVTNKNGKSYTVSPGLQIHITLKNKKSWRLRFIGLDGKEKNPKIGNFPEISFQNATSILNETLDCLARGEKPLQTNVKIAKHHSSQSLMVDLTFKEAFDKFCEFKRGNGNTKHADWAETTLNQHLKIFKKHVLPTLGAYDVKKIVVSDLSNILKRIESSGALSIRDKAFKALRGMYGWMTAKNIEGDKRFPELNLANSIPRETFIKAKSENFKHVTSIYDLKRIVNSIYNLQASYEVKQAIKLQLHLVFRPSMVSKLKWSEVKFLDEQEMVVSSEERERLHLYDLIVLSKERMKMSRGYESTISPQVREILLDMRQKTGYSEYVFLSPYRSGDNKPISTDSMSTALRRNGISDISPHGFRHTASTILRKHLDCDGYEYSTAIEVQLSHSIGGVEQIYNKSDYLKRRSEVMNKWSDFIESLIDVPKEESDKFAGEVYF